MIIKILLFIFLFSLLFLIRELFFFNQAKVRQQQYKSNKVKLLGVGFALAYIITIIVTGFGL